MKFRQVMRLAVDVFSARAAVNKLIKFVTPDTEQEILWAAVTRIVILVRDLVAKSETYAKPITFADDVIVNGRVKDAATLITFMRDAVCHIESPLHMAAENVYSSSNVLFGKRKLANVEEIWNIGCDYEDDVAIIIGTQRMYIKRHLLRAFREASDNLDKFFKELPEDKAKFGPDSFVINYGTSVHDPEQGEIS